VVPLRSHTRVSVDWLELKLLVRPLYVCNTLTYVMMAHALAELPISRMRGDAMVDLLVSEFAGQRTHTQADSVGAVITQTEVTDGMK
jgi:hypothetical protein